MRLAAITCAVFALLLSDAGAWPRKGGGHGKPAAKERKGPRKGAGGGMAQDLRKRAEKDARIHGQEAQRREYRMMLESRQRGERRRIDRQGGAPFPR